MMKGIKNTIKQQTAIVNTADAVNHEGAPAWTKPDRELLHQYALVGVLGNSFYASQTAVVDEATKLLQRCSPEDIAREIVIGRNEGFIRSFPILGLVELSKKSPELFKEAFPQVIKTGNDLGDFIALCRAQRGLGRAIKTALTTWLIANAKPYYAQKYRHQLADAARLVRLNGDVDPIWGYIFACYSDRLKGWTPAKLQAALDKYEELSAHDRFIDAITSGQPVKAVEILRNYSIDVDSLTAYYAKFDATIWKEIARQTPVMRFLKYLDKFDREHVFDKGIELVEQKITVDNLKKAKVFPFRVFAAYSALSKEAYRSISTEEVRDYLAGVLDDYVTGYNWGVFNKFSWCICPDVSGSMRCECSGTLRYRDVAGMFAAMFRKGLSNGQVIPWSDEVFQMPGNKHDSIVSQMMGLGKLDGGTDMTCALRHAISHNIRSDFFVFITDSEEYGIRRWGSDGVWVDAWRDYRRRMNPNSQAFILRLDPYVTNPFPEDQAEKLGIYPVYGWNDNVIKFIEYVVAQRASTEKL